MHSHIFFPSLICPVSDGAIGQCFSMTSCFIRESGKQRLKNYAALFEVETILSVFQGTPFNRVIIKMNGNPLKCLFLLFSKHQCRFSPDF